MRKKYRIHLTNEEQSVLQEIILKRSSKSVQVKRAYVLLAVACPETSGMKMEKRNGQMER